jgi:hypothetical protein
MPPLTAIVSSTDDDLIARPMDYPGRPIAGSGVLLGDQFRGLPAAADINRTLRDVGKPALHQRHAVVAVGSNACAAVMRRKLESVGVDPCVAFLYGTVRAVSVGHSAHRSVAGFIPAAPFRCDGATSRVVVLMLTAEQLEAIDRTEPNYRRSSVDCDVAELGVMPAEVYVSLWGVIAPPGERPLPLSTQVDLRDQLRTRCPQFTYTEPPSATIPLSKVLAEEGWVANSDL